MKKVVSILAVFMMIVSINANAKKWELATQAWTFNRFMLSETLADMQKLGIKYIELYPKQKFSASDDRTTHFSMPDSQIEDLKAMLKAHKIKVESYGVISPNKEADWKKLFEFAKKMGIKTIVSEPKQELLPMIDALCVEYKIRVAIHNHPDPTRYWNPDIVLKALEGRSIYMGACTDLGHWTRSGLDAAVCLKKLEGKVFEIHMKDVNRTDKKGHAVVWGEGIIDWKAVTTELHRQKFSGKWVIEHEHNWENPMPDLKKNVSFFNTSIK
ncbi:sugar phosphate isomerase/epimerase family protein [Saccharicrinis aurantiacus]|uniref:sugar phosphate isomerase/epimerase family protein n=1 Tax=Saccharicrinis aurantiacus TaxID=1849719 RepID=UPI0024935AA3|nr:sugar phosphate isomerase/epimerase [Saccharicrinis aurantiacus]